jgi:class 3 adenylate cyclase/tetratricopeptide (TPR) repeat protein
VDVRAWLESLGLDAYAQAFAANDVDAALLPSLTAEDLRDIGVTSVGHRRRLLDAIAALNAPAAVRPDQPSATALSAPMPLGGDAIAPAGATLIPTPSGVQRRQITVVFCDLVGSTALSARVDPEDLREFLDSYRAAVAAVVQEHTGWVAQYLGDGVLAYFGYPKASETACEQAVRAALRIVDAVAGLPAIGGQPPQVRIGIATGLTVVGKLGGTSVGATEFSAVGEAPNLAARAQSEAQPNSVVIADSTREQIGDLFHYRDLGQFDLKGFQQPTKLWQVLGESHVRSRYAALHGGRAHVSLMGRDNETRRIASRLADAQAGDGQLMVVSGEAGLGKSRLVEHLFELLGRDQTGASVVERLVFQCSPHNVASALHPVRDYIERSAGISSEDGREGVLQKLSSMLARAGQPVPEQISLVAELLRVERAPHSALEGLGSLEVRTRMMRVLCSFLETTAARSSVFVVEDIQWIDPSTSELLENLVPVLRRMPVLFVATSRGGPYPSWLTGPHVGLVQLDRFDAEQTRQIVVAMAAPRQLPESVLEAIVLRSDGVPLYAEELTRGYLEPTGKRASGNQGDLSDDEASAGIPATLSESLLARLDGVTHGREIAPTASVLGREFPIALLAAISALAEPDVRQCVADLLDAGVFVGGRSNFGEAVAFRHLLVREAAYQQLVRRDRVRLHGLVAATVEASFPAIAAALPHIMAMHFAEAGETARAAAQWHLAAADADRRSAYSEALVYYRRALALIISMPQNRARDDLEFNLVLNMIGPLIAVQGLSAIEVEQEIERVSALSQKLGTQSSLIPALALKAVMLGTAGNMPASYALALQISALASGGSETDRLIGHRYLATTLVFWGKFQQAIEEALRFLALFDPARHAQQLVQIGPANHAVMMMVGLAQCYTIMAQADQARHWLEQALLTARSDGRAHTLVQALTFAACFPTALSGDVDALAGYASELKTVTESHGLTQWQGHAALFSGITLMRQCQVEPGLALARQGVHLLVTGHAYSKVWYIVYAQACEEAGAFDDAWHGLELGAPNIAFGHTWLDAEYLRIRGRLKLVGGDPDSASHDFEAALALASEQGATLFVERARRDQEMLALSVVVKPAV